MKSKARFMPTKVQMVPRLETRSRQKNPEVAKCPCWRNIGVMHEMAVTEGLLTLAEEHAGKAQAARVTDVYMVIGQLSSFVDDSIQFYWEIMSEGTHGCRSG